MADLNLDILVIDTHNSKYLGIADISTYPDSPPVQSPTIEITIPGFGMASLPFVPVDFNVFTSTTLGITSVTDDIIPLPDGVYTLTYSVTPAYENFVTKTIIRVDQLLQLYNEAFLTLDMMVCDKAIKTQDKVTLSTVYFLIQGSIAAANNCAEFEAGKLYVQAKKLLDNFINKDCGCSGNNYLINFSRY
jgi:hypothetical protein